MRFARKHYIISSIVVLILVIVVGIAVSSRTNGDQEVFIVEKIDVTDEVRISGRVEAGIVADLGFEVTGSVRSVFVNAGEEVSAGQSLVSLSLGTLPAELAAAQANVSIKEAETGSDESSLDAVIAQQDTLVDNAYRALLSDDLVSRPKSDSTTQTPPTITGSYSGPEGQYDARFKKGSQLGDYILFIKGLEDISETDVEENPNESTPLGTYGLFVSFPDTLSSYKDTSWLIDIPNTEGASYTTNLNAYEKSLQDREVAIENAQAQLDSDATGFSVAQAELAVAQAEVARISAEIAKRTLTAPISGVVSVIDIDLGEIVSANETVMQVISQGDFGVEIDLPEIESVKVNAGDPATVTLDPFGDGVVFDATVLSVNTAETLLDNVAVYEARIRFDDQDERIASGMTAEVTIQTDSREGVLAVPLRAIQERDDGTKYVLKHIGDTDQETTITTGLKGADSFVEILSGLKEGDGITIPE